MTRMNPERLAAIRAYADRPTTVSRRYMLELLDALEYAQADAKSIAAVRMETGRMLLEAQHRADKYRDEAHLLTEERDAALAENAHLEAANDDLGQQLRNLEQKVVCGLEPHLRDSFFRETELRARVKTSERERDRLASQVTDLQQFLGAVRATLGEAARLNATDAEWARQGYAAFALLVRLGSLAEQPEKTT